MTTCPEEGSFTIVDFEYNSSTEPEHECFYAVEGSSSTGGRFEFSPAYVWNGESTTEGPYVYLEEFPLGSAWAIGYWMNDETLIAVCHDDDYGDATPAHPTDVVTWSCDEVSSSFTVTCDLGCDFTQYPSPSPALGAAPASSPPAPTDVNAPDADSSPSSSPLDKAEVWVGIVGGIASTLALLVALVRHLNKKRRGQS